jgi:lipopolysaccharide transport system ATP-binding protein
MASITFDRVSKSFKRSHRKVLGAHLRELFASKSVKEEPFFAVRDLSFTVEPGRSLGLVGANGAGKSTTLALATGICLPTTGTIHATGRTVGLLELGSGFHPELSGMENMQLNSAILGMTRKEAKAAEPKIIEFADIGDYIHEPLRTYSSGMMLRLAFSVAIHSDPDVLIVDEVIGVGDVAFQHKCNERLRALRERKVTILCTSHSPEVLREMCDELLWIDKGRMRKRGGPDEVLEAYLHG